MIHQGRFDEKQWNTPIHIKECLATTYALRASGISNCFATVYTDNTIVFNALRKFGTKFPELRPFVTACIDFQIQNNVSLEFVWIPSHMNVKHRARTRS